MDHIAGAGTGSGSSSMVLYITSDISTTGSVDVADGTSSQPFTVTANQVKIVTIPSSTYLGNSSTIVKKGIHITSKDPIAVYAHIYASSVSGATLLFPVNAMGKTYVSLNYTQISNESPSYSEFAVIGTEDNTTVSITPSVNLIDGHNAGVAFTIPLNKGEVYQGLANNQDLTGTKIQSISTSIGICKKIAVFSGSNKISITCSEDPTKPATSDNLFQQVYPTSAWGKNYITAPLQSRGFDIYRVVLSDPNTNVTINGTAIAASQFTSGYYEFKSTVTNVISADKAIQVVQYSPSQRQGLNSSGGCSTLPNDVGDPEMIYLSPIEQGLDHVTLYSSGYFAIKQSYINVVIPTSAVASFTVDGSSSDVNKIPYASYFSSIPNSNYSYAQIPVTSGPPPGVTIATAGTHNIKASQPFNAIAYGFGPQESYGYAAGTNLQDLTEYVRFQNPQNNNFQTSGCAGINYKLQVTIPYPTTNIAWKVDGILAYTDIAPIPISQKVQGTQTLYTYEYPNMVNYPTGSHIIIATVFNPVADDCGNNVDINYNFDITAPPTGDFTVSANTCLGDTTKFTDATVFAAGNYAKSWQWDFGDGQTSTLQNPNHVYTTSGNYTIGLTITDNNGCSSIVTKTTHIATSPIAHFTLSTPDCAGQNVTFTNNSTATDGTIVSWAWDYGDGTNATLTNGQPFTHVYANAGNYNATLIVTTDKGCSSTVFTQAITVNPVPLVDFTLPDVCLDDAFALFTNKTTIADNSTLTYSWDFGDAARATAANPNTSTSVNPQHKYLAAGNYTVTLTVTSASGCVTTKSQPFTVNGSIPKAEFSYPANICSSDDVVFTNQSTVTFGNFTKIVWYYDFNGNPGISETFTSANMPADGKFMHNYGLFSTPLQKNYQVKMVVYSGETCVNEVSHTITVNANPVITLNPASSIALCQSDSPLQIAENTNGFVGTGVFTGTGVSTTGLFDPAKSGPGTFTINYLFTSSSTGCTYATSLQITVNPTPVITLAADAQLLQGGQITLNATATVSSGTLTYKWSPSTGLSRDDILNPIASPTDDITYTLLVTSDKFCSAAAKIAITVLKDPVVNNTFTPNGDGINDTWTIKYLDQYPKATVEIFNRLGAKVYFSNGYPTPWDGKYKGSDLPAGVYYYIINPNSGRKAISGYISIIR
ncbi:PKD domain-containing protein [Mucilaginibacter sp.]